MGQVTYSGGNIHNWSKQKLIEELRFRLNCGESMSRKIQAKDKKIEILEKALNDILFCDKQTFRSDYGNFNRCLEIAKEALNN